MFDQGVGKFIGCRYRLFPFNIYQTIIYWMGNEYIYINIQV